MSFRTFAIEHPAHFLSEQRTMLYEKYCIRVVPLKNVLGAKSSLQGLALLGLDRNGAKF